MIREVKEGILINLRILPNSKKCEFVKSEDILKVKITAQPIDGKANKCLIEFLSKTFKIPKTSVIITKGETSKEKTILFKDADDNKIRLIKEILGVKDAR